MAFYDAVATIVVFAIIAVIVIVVVGINRYKDGQAQALRKARDERDLARRQLKVAKDALSPDAQLGSVTAQVALDEIRSLSDQFEQAHEKELESGR